MLADSGLLGDLQRFAFSPTGRPMCIYGDMAYPLRVHLQTQFRHLPLAPPMQEYNESMSSMRIAVEWLFGDITNTFKYLDFKKNLKIGLLARCTLFPHCFAMQLPAFMGMKPVFTLVLSLPLWRNTFSKIDLLFFRKWNDTPFSCPVPTPLLT